MMTTKTGPVTLQTTGATVPLKICRTSPEFSRNLLSVGALLDDGWTWINASPKTMTMRHSSYGTLTFQRHPDRDGLYHLQGQLPNKLVQAYAMETEKVSVKPAQRKPTRTLNVMEAHCLLGHPESEKRTREAAAKLNWSLTGKWTSCLSCLEAKAKRKPVPKESTTQATRPGQRLLLDLTG